MRRAAKAGATLATALLAGALVGASAHAQAEEGASWDFDSDAAGQPPTGFSFGRTGSGAQGQWVVQAEADAPSAPNVLAQLDADATDHRFPVAVADEPSLRDVRLSVRCMPVSGKVDQAYVARLLNLCDAMPAGFKVMLFAFERFHDRVDALSCLGRNIRKAYAHPRAKGVLIRLGANPGDDSFCGNPFRGLFGE